MITAPKKCNEYSSFLWLKYIVEIEQTRSNSFLKAFQFASDKNACNV